MMELAIAEAVVETVKYREELISFIWDAAKEEHGIRPRWINFEAASLPQLEALAGEYWNVEPEIVEEAFTMQVAPANLAFAEALNSFLLK